MATTAPTTRAIGNATGLPLPEAESDVTLDWLRDALADALPPIRSASVERIIPGTATKILIGLRFDGADTPLNVCVKGAFDPGIRAYDLGTIFACEAAFYRDIGSKLEVALPRCHYADEDGVFGVLVLEDLVARGATFGDPTENWSAEQAAGILDVLARVHAFTWDWKPGALRWLTGSDALRNGILGMAAPEKFPDLIGRPQVRDHLPAPLANRDTWLGKLQTLWAADERQTLALGHGDAHLGQTYIDGDGRPGLLDWQCAGLMPWAKDVAYFIGGALAPADRRMHERALIDGYLAVLAQQGGPTIDREMAWHEYRKQMLQGICWTMVTEQMQPLAAITVMNERYLTAIHELGTLDAIG